MRIGKIQQLRIGDSKLVTKFLWFPKCIDFQWRWFEKTSWYKIWTGYNWIDREWKPEFSKYYIANPPF